MSNIEKNQRWLCLQICSDISISVRMLDCILDLGPFTSIEQMRRLLFSRPRGVAQMVEIKSLSYHRSDYTNLVCHSIRSEHSVYRRLLSKGSEASYRRSRWRSFTNLFGITNGSLMTKQFKQSRERGWWTNKIVISLFVKLVLSPFLVFGCVLFSIADGSLSIYDIRSTLI